MISDKKIKLSDLSARILDPSNTIPIVSFLPWGAPMLQHGEENRILWE
jgi:hypothetical protein